MRDGHPLTFHRLFDHFKQGIGKLTVVNDHGGRFESTNVYVVADRVRSKQQDSCPCGGPVFQVAELVQRSKWVCFV